MSVREGQYLRSAPPLLRSSDGSSSSQYFSFACLPLLTLKLTFYFFFVFIVAVWPCAYIVEKKKKNRKVNCQRKCETWQANKERERESLRVSEIQGKRSHTPSSRRKREANKCGVEFRKDGCKAQETKTRGKRAFTGRQTHTHAHIRTHASTLYLGRSNFGKIKKKNRVGGCVALARRPAALGWSATHCVCAWERVCMCTI